MNSNFFLFLFLRKQHSVMNYDSWSHTVYRLNEIVNVYGLSIKELIEEKAGNGIMSAIDCKIDVQMVDDGAGKEKRIELRINGKFLRYCLWARFCSSVKVITNWGYPIATHNL